MAPPTTDIVIRTQIAHVTPQIIRRGAVCCVEYLAKRPISAAGRVGYREAASTSRVTSASGVFEWDLRGMSRNTTRGAGADLLETQQLAESLGEAIAAEPVNDNRLVTMSFGVSASARGDAFCYQEIFAAADIALYQAKQAGRDCVCIATSRADESRLLVPVG
jgi:hypothetical protein